MAELRKKTEGATDPGADRREYVVGVELLDRGRATTGSVRRRPPAPATSDSGRARSRKRSQERQGEGKPKANRNAPGRWRS